MSRPTALVLAAAGTNRDHDAAFALDLAGAVKFAFQPAEEVSNGAQAMIGDGVLDGPTVHAAFGIHLWNDLPVGTIGIMAGPVMASVDQFEIEILGRRRWQWWLCVRGCRACRHWACGS